MNASKADFLFITRGFYFQSYVSLCDTVIDNRSSQIEVAATSVRRLCIKAYIMPKWPGGFQPEIFIYSCLCFDPVVACCVSVA